MEYSLSFIILFNPKPISMQKNSLLVNKENIKIYRTGHHPSSLSYFLKSLVSVIVMGKSPSGSVGYYRIRKTSK
jgi:hypothetical protein